MKSSSLRSVTRRLPFPGTTVRRLLDAVDPWIDYPRAPMLTTARWRLGTFEIHDCREYIQRNIYFLGYYGLRETLLLRRLLRPGDVFVDVGANLGWFSVVAARLVGAGGRVVAFEPSAAIFRHLQRSIEVNRLTNVVTEQLAVSDVAGEAMLTGVSARNAGLGSIMDDAAEGSAAAVGAERVRTVTLSDYCAAKGLLHLRVVKVDVEGAEMKVLDGMRSLLERRACDYLVVEVNDERLRASQSSAGHLLDFVRAHGYRARHIGLRACRAVRQGEEIGFANLLFEAGPRARDRRR